MIIQLRYSHCTYLCITGPGPGPGRRKKRLRLLPFFSPAVSSSCGQICYILFSFLLLRCPILSQQYSNEPANNLTMEHHQNEFELNNTKSNSGMLY